MPFFRSAHLQTLTTCLIALLYVLALIRMAALLSTTSTSSDTSPLIDLEGSIRHASFIKLQPFGFTGIKSSFRMNVEITMRKVSAQHAAALRLTNRTTFWLMLCNEDEWKTIKSVAPSYCNTPSYFNADLCHSFPLDVLQSQSSADEEDQTFTSTSVVQHNVATNFFGRLVVSSCELKENSIKRSCSPEGNSIGSTKSLCTFPPLEDRVEMRLQAGLTMKNNDNVYIGFENDTQQLLVMLLLGVCIVLATLWSFLLVIYRRYSNRLQIRMVNILISKGIHFVFAYCYWIKRRRGDVWSTYKDEMMQLESALEMLSLAIMLECVLLVSVGWSITQSKGKLSSKSWKLVYGTLSGYFLSILLKVVSSSLHLTTPIIEVVALLLYLFATFSTYYLICFATSAIIEALESQLLLIERYLQIDPKTTPSWSKLKMFRQFRIWVTVYVTATTATQIISLAVRGNDDHEKNDVYVDIFGYFIELTAVVALLCVFRPKAKSRFFRRIPVVNIDDTTDRMVPGIEVTPPGVRLQRLPTVTGVILQPYRDEQALPPVVVGRLLDVVEGNNGLSSSSSSHTLTGRVMVHPSTPPLEEVEMIALPVVVNHDESESENENENASERDTF